MTKLQPSLPASKAANHEKKRQFSQRVSRLEPRTQGRLRGASVLRLMQFGPCGERAARFGGAK